MNWKNTVAHIDFQAGTTRLKLIVGGRVQGVGFRPTVFRYAKEASAGGFVKNTREGVVIEIEGPAAVLNEFGRNIVEHPPPLARIDRIEASLAEPAGEREFVILPSDEPGGARALFPIDTATCGECLRELRDPGDRRYRYPFINCTNCGPRFTIIEGLPYDRPRTTMSTFAMCAACRAEYGDPADRRFHAEPVSCPACGPVLTLIDARGKRIAGDPIDGARERIAGGAIVAVKGLGGYHIACSAAGPGPVRTLRERKRRPAKPFALMFRDLDTLLGYCRAGEIERRLLESPEAPIVLLRRAGIPLPGSIAPGNGYIGAFLPYTPVHHLLMETFDVLVMTSANYTDEPLISNEEELEGILGSIADAALVHDRPIAHKCDDSIFFVPAGIPVPIRRARGFVPEPAGLPRPVKRCILALGGQMKGTFAVSRDDEVFISPHMGDLGDFRSQRNFRAELEEFIKILEVEPDVVVHDLHPDYFTTRLADGLGIATRIAVQHHHAHAVSVMAEYGLDEPVIAVTFDGTGFGSDGKLWGCEFLLARYDDFERLAHLAYLPLPGGEAAIMEPWRMALVHLWNLFGDDVLGAAHPAAHLLEPFPRGKVLELARRGINAPLTSSMGRLFDAAAFLLRCGGKVSYEAEAAVALEALALDAEENSRYYRFGLGGNDVTVIDPAPVIRGLLDDMERGVARSDIAAAFHESVARLVVGLSEKLAGERGIADVVLSGGVFQNRLLCERIAALGESCRCRLHHHVLVPPNDGGISFGQVRVGAARLEKRA